jgi:hypothetical protein
MKRILNRGAIAAAIVAAAGTASAQNFGDWGNAVPETAINTPAAEGCPIESKDGLSLYIASNRPGTLGALDIFRAHRESVDGPWWPAEHIPAPVNSAAFDYCPTPLQGQWLLFVSSRDTETDADPANDDCIAGPAPLPPPGGPAPGDIYLVRENPAHSWTEPLHLGCVPEGPNTAGAEFSPSLVETAEGTFLYFSSNGYGDGGGFNIYASRILEDGTVLPGERVEELSTLAHDNMPNVRKDGREIVFISDRDGPAGVFDIYVASRENTAEAWSAPVRIANPTINDPAASESRPSLSGDGTRLHFGRNNDIFVSTRSKHAEE